MDSHQFGLAKLSLFHGFIVNWANKIFIKFTVSPLFGREKSPRMGRPPRARGPTTRPKAREVGAEKEETMTHNSVKRMGFIIDKSTIDSDRAPTP